MRPPTTTTVVEKKISYLVLANTNKMYDARHRTTSSTYSKMDHSMNHMDLKLWRRCRISMQEYLRDGFCRINHWHNKQYYTIVYILYKCEFQNASKC